MKLVSWFSYLHWQAFSPLFVHEHPDGQGQPCEEEHLHAEVPLLVHSQPSGQLHTFSDFPHAQGEPDEVHLQPSDLSQGQHRQGLEPFEVQLQPDGHGHVFLLQEQEEPEAVH